MGVISDIDVMRTMIARELWDNYIESMDMVIECLKVPNRDGALFYMAVVKISLDMYFDAVEEILLSEDSTA